MRRYAFLTLALGAALATSCPLGPAVAEQPARRVVAEAVAARVEADYVFADKAAAAARLVRSRARSGAYDRAGSERAFVEALTADLFSVTRDKHLVVRHSAAGYPKAEPVGQPDPSAQEAELRALRRQNFSVPRAEVLPGNIGYLRIDLFQAPQDAGPTLVAAMGFLKHTEALIFDLRENGGGDAAAVALVLSYLVPPQTQFVSYRDRAGKEAQSWSAPYAPGGPWSTTRPVYVLTSGKTFSAAEEFAYDLQQLKRGTIVGARSRGGANPGVIHRLSDHHRMFVPNEAAVSPLSGGNWEGVGVSPDVAVEPAQALSTAHRLGLKALLAKASAAETPELEAALSALDRESPQPEPR